MFFYSCSHETLLCALFLYAEEHTVLGLCARCTRDLIAMQADPEAEGLMLAMDAGGSRLGKCSRATTIVASKLHVMLRSRGDHEASPAHGIADCGRLGV